MKIAIATDNGQVSAHFGRCPSYTIVTLDGTTVTEKTLVDNPGHEPGKIPEFLDRLGVKVIIAGGMGPRAQSFFSDFGIRTIVGATGATDSVIENYIRGIEIAGPTLCSEGGGRGYGISKTVCDHN